MNTTESSTPQVANEEGHGSLETTAKTDIITNPSPDMKDTASDGFLKQDGRDVEGVSPIHYETATRKRDERILVLKQDLVLIPFAFALYVAAYLDRSNLGNGRLQGLEHDVLGDDDNKYSIALSAFFITYIIFAIPGTLAAKQYDPSSSIAFGTAVWAVAATTQAAVQNPAGLYVATIDVCRLFLGIGEAFFGMAMSAYLSIWYTKTELAKRIGFFVSAGSVAGAFGGLIAYGVARLPKTDLAQWRKLYLIEGTPVFLLAVLVYFFLPSRPSKSRFLTEPQRELAELRMRESQSHLEENGIDWKAARYSFWSTRTWITAVMYSCLNLGLASVSAFLPTIVKGLGYSNADAQLYTVPPYVVALVFMLLISSYSDRKQTRGIPVALVFAVGVLGWSLLLGLPARGTRSELHGRYFACIAVVSAGYASIPLILSWVAPNSPNESGRAVALGALNTVGQGLSIAAAFLFPSKEGPQFRKGTSLNIGFQALGIVIALSLSLYCRRENKRRDAKEGGRPPIGTVLDTKGLYDLAPGFRYVP